MGAADYVTKRFSVKELLATADAPEVFRFGECELNLASTRLTRKGAEMALTPKEHKLLRYFLSRPGRALPRDDIMDAV